jgi:hypothetical protein
MLMVTAMDDEQKPLDLRQASSIFTAPDGFEASQIGPSLALGWWASLQA